MRKSWPGRRRYTDGLKKLPFKASDTQLAELWGSAVVAYIRYRGVFIHDHITLVSLDLITRSAHIAALHGRRAIRQGRTA